jgi:hypothetical protein
MEVRYLTYLAIDFITALHHPRPRRHLSLLSSTFCCTLQNTHTHPHHPLLHHSPIHRNPHPSNPSIIGIITTTTTTNSSLPSLSCGRHYPPIYRTSTCIGGYCSSFYFLFFLFFCFIILFSFLITLSSLHRPTSGIVRGCLFGGEDRSTPSVRSPSRALSQKHHRTTPLAARPLAA